MSYRYIDSKKLLNGVTFFDQNGAQHVTSDLDTWTPEQRTAANIEPVPPSDPKPNSKFYWPDGTPKALEDKLEFEEDGVTPIINPETGQQLVTRGLKYNAIQLAKRQARDALKDTDWMVIRGVENPGKPVGTTVANYRSAVRAKSGEIEALIAACTTLEEFIDLHKAPVDVNGDPTGANPPIVDWPKPVEV